MLAAMRVIAGLYVVACLAVSVTAQAASAPAPGAATPALYQRPLNGDCVTSGSGTNYFPLQFQIGGTSSSAPQQDHVNVTVAQDFTVQYMDSYKIVTNLYVNETYVLYQCGTARPAADMVPTGSKFFEIPLTSVSVTETIPYAYMEALSVIDRIYSVSSYTVAPCGQLQAACGQLAPTPEEFTPELLDDTVLPYVDGIITSSGNATLEPLFAFSASTDPGALNRAEWLKFLGMFFNLDDSANTIFNEINSSYYRNSAMYKAATSSSSPPTVAWISRIDNETSECINSFEVSYAPYKVQYTRDAGGNVTDMATVAAMPNVIESPCSANTLSFAWEVDVEGYTGGFATEADAVAGLQSFLQTVDVLIDETYAYDPTQYDFAAFLETYEITDNQTANATFPFLRNAAMFREDGLESNSSLAGLGSDWFEGALVRPDIVLSDVARAINSSSVPSNYTFTWIRNVATGEQPVIQSPLGCLTPASGISVVASAPTGAPAEAPAAAAALAAASAAPAPGPSGSSSPTLTSVVDGNTTTLISCPATPARNVPTICPYVKSCGVSTPAATLTNSTNGCQYTVCTA